MVIVECIQLWIDVSPTLDRGGMNCKPNHRGVIQGHNRKRCSRVSGSEQKIEHRGVSYFLFIEGGSRKENVVTHSPDKVFYF